MPQRRRNSPDVVTTTGGGLPPSTMAKQQSQRTMMQPFPSSLPTTSVKASGPPSGLSNFLARGVKLFGRSASITKSSQSSPHVDASQSQQRPQQDRIRQRNVSGPTLVRTPPPPSQNGQRLVLPASRSVLDLSSPSAYTTDNSPSAFHSDAIGDLRRISKLSWAHSADDLGTLRSPLDTNPPSTVSGPRPSLSDRSTPVIETPATAEEFRQLPLNIRIEAYRNGVTPIPSPIQTTHPPAVGKTHGAISPSVSSPIHPRFSHDMLQVPPSVNDAPSPASSNTSHNRSLSHNMLGVNGNGAAPLAPVEPSRPLPRQNPVLGGADRADRTKSNNFAFPFSFGKPIANGGLAEPQTEPKKRLSQITQHSGFLNRNTGTGVPRDLFRDWKAYKAEIKGSKLYLYKPPHDRASAVKGLFVTDTSLVDEPGEVRTPTESPTESRKPQPFWGPGPHRDTLRDDKGSIVGGTAEALVYEMVFGPLFINERKEFDEDAWKEFSRPILFCLPALTGRDAFENGFVNSADHYIRYLNDQKALRDGRERVEWLLSQYAYYLQPESPSPVLEVFLSTFSFTITQPTSLQRAPFQPPVPEYHASPRPARNVAPPLNQTSEGPNANANVATFVENLDQRGLNREVFTHFDSLVITKSLDTYFKSERAVARNLLSSGILERSLDDVRHPWATFFGTEARPHWLTLLIVKQIVGPSNNCLSGARNSESGGGNMHSASKTHLRSQSITRWIHVGEHFRQLGNEAAWRAIMEGICARPVARLEKAWRRVEIVERQVIEGWIRDGKVSTGRAKENVPWLAEKTVLLAQALGNVQHQRDGKAELDLQGMKIVMNSVQNVLQGWDGYTDESGGADADEVASALLLYWKHFAEIVRTKNMIPAGGVDYYLTQSLNAEPAQRSLYSVHHHKPRSQHYTAHAITPFIFPEPLPSISLLDRRAILRVRKESLDKPQRLDEGRMKRVAQLKLLSAEHSLLGLGGTRVDSDLKGETVFRLFGGEIIVKVAKEPQDSRPNSTLENGPTLTRKPSKALGIRVTPQAASTLERKPSAARRQSLPLLTASRLASAERSVNPTLIDLSVPVVIIAGTVERLVDVLVRGLDYVTAATSDDNGEMTLRDRKSRSMRLDQTEFSKTWWNTHRSFVTPDIFVMMLLRLFDTTLPSTVPSNHDHTDDANLRLSILTVLSDWITQGGGAQDLLDNADICRELRHFLHNDEKHAVPEGVWKGSVDRPAWEEVQDLRRSLVTLFERLIRRPSLSALIVHEPGPSERAYGPHPPDIDSIDVEDLVGCLDAIGATAFRYIQPEDLLAVADFLEIQSADRTGWLTISEPQVLSQEEVEIQTIYSYLQLVDTSPLISKYVRGPVYKLFPPSVRATIRGHIACRHWIISKIAAQGIGRRARQSRIELFLQAIEISRSRSQGVFVDGMEESPVVRSFVETVLTSALLSPQSRLFTRVWQDVATKRGASIDSFETFISTPLASVTGRKPTVDFGWLLERMIEIVSLPDTLQDDGDSVGLVNFEKRRHLCNFVYTVPTLVPGRSPKQKVQLDMQDADRMTAMLDDSRWILDYPKAVKEEAHKENTFSTSSGQGRRLSRPFSRTIIAQQEKNKRDRQFRDHFSREKKLEQQRLEKQSVTYEKTMALAKGGSISISKAPKHAKKASSAFFRVVRPLSTAFPFSHNTATATSTRQWSLPELDFTPTNKPSLSINLAAARTKAVTGKARSYVFTVDTEDNGRFYFQAINRKEMEKWLKAIEKTSTTTAEKRRTYVGPTAPIELLTRSRNLGRHPTAVFGVDLAYLIERDHGQEPPPGAVPRILADGLQQVEQRGFTEIGIYRISGSKLAVDSLKFDYNTGRAVDLNEQDIHNVCSLVKLWLREIPGGLFPGKAFWQVIQSLQSVEGRLPDAMAECIGMLQTVIDDLPTANYHVLRCICDHLVQASTHEELTNMAEGNFAICFGQTTLTPPDDQAAIMATGYANRFVNILLNNYHAIFERDQENEAEGEADEEGGEAPPDTHYLEGLEEEEEEEDRVSSAGHVFAGTTTSVDSYGLAL